MNLTLPDDIPALRNMTEAELRRELALSLYAARRVTVVQAADVAGVSLFELQALLRDRRIPQHYDETELDKDLLVLRDLGSR